MVKRIVILALVASLSGLSSAGSEEWCLYFLDATDGNVYRSRIDGSHRELVVSCRAKKGVTFAATWPNLATRGVLHLANVPSYAGYIVLDGSGARALKTPPAFCDQSGKPYQTPVPLAWTDRPTTSNWTLTYGVRCEQLEAKHRHYYPTVIVLSNGRVARRFAVGDSGKLLGLFSDGKAVVSTQGAVYLWDLKSDRRQLVARASDATIWMRDLRRKERIKPIANALLTSPAPGLAAGRYGWTMKDPADFVVKPEYLRKKSKKG